MQFPFLFAWRYLFGKKSTNAINIITGVSMLGLAVGTAALILVLSVFNGFEGLLARLMNAVNADVKVSLKQGKTFYADSIGIGAIKSIEGVASVSLTLEETALVEYEGKQDFCTLKGVEDNYNLTTTIDSAIYRGEFKLRDDLFDYVVMGGGIANRLNVNVANAFEPLNVYMPRRNVRSPLDKPFKKLPAYPAGRFSIKQDYDYMFVFSSLEFVQELLERKGEASAIEINVEPDNRTGEVVRQIEAIMGERFEVKDRYAQNDALFKLMQIEKWLSYAIAGLVLFIVSFNLVGALWMIVLDKKRDLAILKAMGATTRQVRNLVLCEGFLMSAIGLLTGVVLAVVIFLLQKHVGLITFPEGFVVDSYPVELRTTDFVAVCLTVLFIGSLASVLPAMRSTTIGSYVREE